MAHRRHLLDRYGADLEADLFERYGIDVVDFYRPSPPHRDGAAPRPPRHSWTRFDSLVERLQRRTDTWISGARATDVDAYRAARDAGLIDKRKKGRTDPVEWGTTEQILGAIFLLLQQQVHATYVAGTKAARKKPKLNPWPAPRTAEALVRAEDIRVTFHHLETEVIRPVSPAEYAELVAAAVGPELPEPVDGQPLALPPAAIPDGLSVLPPAPTTKPVPAEVADPFHR